MSSRTSLILAVILLLTAATLRMWDLTTLPPGYSNKEIEDVRIIESARNGNISVFYDLGREGREGLYHIFQALITAVTGRGPLGLRMLSVWTNLLALSLLYALVWRLFGRIAGLAAMALLATSLWPVLLSRTIGREAVIPFLITVIVFSMSLILPIYRRRRRRGDNTSTAAMMGFFLGVSLYVHPIGLLLILFVVACIGYMIFWYQHMSRRRISYLSFAVLLMIIMSMPYMISSIRTPQLGGMERLTGEQLNLSLTPIIDSIVAIAYHGDTNPLNNLPGRPLFDPISALLIATGLVITIINWRQSRNTVVLIGLVIFAPVFLMAANAPNFLNYSASLPFLAILFGVGYNGFKERIPRRANLLAMTGLVLLVIGNSALTFNALFNEWRNLPEAYAAYNGRLGQLAHHIDTTSDEIPTVICGWNPYQSPEALNLSASQVIDLMSHRRNGDIRRVDCRNGFIMTNGGETQHIIIPDANVLENAHPEIKRWLELGEFLDGDLPQQGIMTFEAVQTLADRAGLFTVTTPVTYAPEVTDARDLIVAPPISFTNNLTLLGYIGDRDLEYRPGDTVSLTTYWRIQDGVVPSDLRLFTHILSDPGASPPANNDTIYVYPQLLQNRDVFVNVTEVQLPASLPDGEYTISIGAYRDRSGERLFILDNGETRGTRLFLFNITVKASP